MSEPGPEYSHSAALVPVEERTVLFYGDEIQGGIVIHPPSGWAVYVPIAPLCDFLGIDSRAQRQRIQRDPVLAEEARSVLLDTAGGPQEMLCLPLDMLNGWLFGISAARVREDVRERVIRYQRECYRVLAAAFGAAPAVARGGLADVEQTGYAIARLAREQMAFEERADEQFVKHSRRLDALELVLSPGSAVSNDQAMQISQAVKAVALALGKKTGRSEFGNVYGELYRRFAITSYKLLPRRRFDEAMGFLREWFLTLVDTAAPPF